MCARRSPAAAAAAKPELEDTACFYGEGTAAADSSAAMSPRAVAPTAGADARDIYSEDFIKAAQ